MFNISVNHNSLYAEHVQTISTIPDDYQEGNYQTGDTARKRNNMNALIPCWSWQRPPANTVYIWATRGTTYVIDSRIQWERDF